MCLPGWGGWSGLELTDTLVYMHFEMSLHTPKDIVHVYDQNFFGVGGSSERCLKWGGGGGEVIKGSFQKHLKTGGGQKLFVGERGFEGVTTPPPRKILIIHCAALPHTVHFMF